MDGSSPEVNSIMEATAAEPDFVMGFVRVAICVLLVVCSAYFSSAESAYARANKIRLKNFADNGNKKAKRALSIANRFDKALVTLLIGNNIVNNYCASVAALAFIDFFGEGDRIAVISTVVTTVVVLICGEVLPKNFANANSDKVAVAYSGLLGFLMKLFTPVSFLFSKYTSLVSKIFGAGDDERITEEELETIIESVEESGSLDEEQAELLQGAVEFTKTPVEDVMTMREDIVGIELHDSAENILNTVRSTTFSRFPVYDGDIDHVVGILSAREYLRTYLRRQNVNLRRVMFKPKFATPDTAIDDLFNEMSASKQQFLVVRDEAGATVGVATIEDFLEEIVGEIWDENDEYDEDFIKLGGNYFSISPKMKVGDALKRIGAEVAIPFDIQKKTLEAWLRSKLDENETPLAEDEGFTFGNLAIMAGEMEDGNTLSAVKIRLCDNEEEAKEELE